MAKILVIDNDETVCRRIGEILNRAGHETYCTKHAREGAIVWRKVDLDLIITNIVMPEMDGIEVIRSLRYEALKIPIIVLSSKNTLNSEYSISACLLLGAKASIEKNCLERELGKTVERIVDRSAG